MGDGRSEGGDKGWGKRSGKVGERREKEIIGKDEIPCRRLLEPLLL